MMRTPRVSRSVGPRLVRPSVLCHLAWVIVLVSAVSAHAAADPAVWRRQVIYLVMPDRFHNGDPGNDRLGVAACLDPADPRKFHGGDIDGVRRKIDYLRSLGVTAVWITPVYKQIVSDGSLCGYHGYWPDFADPPDGAIEPKLGTAADVSALSSALRTRGLKLILDMVVNHAGYSARVVTQHPDWFHSPDTCATLGDVEIVCPLAGLPDFRQELDGGAVTDFLIKETTGWLARFPVDGIRMDTAKHVPGWFFRDFWIPAVRRAGDTRFLVGEVFREDSAAQLAPFVEQGFDSVFNFPLRRAFVNAFARGGSVDAVAGAVQDGLGRLGLDRMLMLVNLLDNHDVPRFVDEPGVGVPESEIRQRYHLALVMLFTLPGIPQLYYGDELGLYGGADPDNRRDMPAWAWTVAGRAAMHPGEAVPTAQTTFTLVQRLIALRKANPALTDGGYAEMWRHNGDPNPNVFVFFRGAGDNRLITAVNNGADASGLVVVPVSGNGGIGAADRARLADGTVLVDLLDAGAPPAATITDGMLPIALPGKVAAIYRPAGAAGRTAATFRVTADTTFGQSVYVVGDAGELGAWEPRRAVRMRPSGCNGSRCTWSVTVRYMPRGAAVRLKFLKKASSATAWEGGPDRAFTVPSAASALYDGQRWQD